MSNDKTILPPEPTDNRSVAERLSLEAQRQIQEGQMTKQKLVYLELNGCSGNIISVLNGSNPDFEYAITSMVDLLYSNSLMAAEGENAVERLFNLAESGEKFILAVEGAVALKNKGMYHLVGKVGDRPVTGQEIVELLGKKAEHVIAVGACAVDGGPSAARPNLSQSVGIQRVLNRTIIKLPGCPVNPDWFLGTLAHLLMFGQPKLDDMNRPLLFYSTLIHDRCPRRPYFDQGIFSKTLGEPYCLFKIGCRGPVTRTDCPTRKWNDHVNWPIGASTCIGCAQFGFPDRMEPFTSYEATRDDENG
ncbi:hydrogenase small subunit [Thalassobacillus hwangdonensis]|uniref:Hydrogenase small subunit n=1 Tax=Thalassobacillus hwangdonensis TaxID=546108 RepID=A0ABW3L004_9BACI